LPAFARRIKKFSGRHEPRSAAAVLVEAVHALLRLYDRSADQREGGGGRGKGSARWYKALYLCMVWC